ncbi:MAG: dihydroorotase, partial [Flavobacteriaceae bacterium]|nr:dihydroorotase [Flavobacteriaceae bacterium]
MSVILIKNAKIVNEGKIENQDILIDGEFIVKVDKNIDNYPSNSLIIDAQNKYLIPGVIDDQVHFREPG